MSDKVDFYTISAYASDAYVISIPLKTSAAWLRKTLSRKDIINGEPLTRKQFDAVRSKIGKEIGLMWYAPLSYFIEGRTNL